LGPTCQNAQYVQQRCEGIRPHPGGGTLSVDEFDDGLAPPDFGYAVGGSPGPELGGVLAMDESGSVSGGTGSSSQRVGQLVGAPLGDDFRVTTRFDLVLPRSVRREGQAVYLIDFDPGTGALHLIAASLASSRTGVLRFELTDLDLRTGTITDLGWLDMSSLASDPLAQQVELQLDAVGGGGTATATLRTIGAAGVLESFVLPQSASLSSGRVPEAGALVFALPEPGPAIGLSIGGLALLSLRARREAASLRRVGRLR